MEKRRRNVSREMILSEKTYLEHLDILMKVFVDPLSCTDFASKNDCKVLFGEIRSIRLVNQVLCDHIAEGDLIGAFATLTPYLKLYSSYARNFPSSQHLLQQLCKDNKKFDSFVRSQEDKPECRGLKLPALLIMPIQRVPRYKLLLEQLLQCTADAQEAAQLEDVLEQINQVAELVNECVRDYDNSLKIISIQKCLDSCAPKLLVPGRKFIKEGVLKKETRRGHYRVQQRMFWLFSDVLLYAKPHVRKKGHFLCSCVLPLRHCYVERTLGTNMFLISCKGERLWLSAESYQEAEQWVTALGLSVQQAIAGRQTLRKDSSRRVPLHRSFLARVRHRPSTMSRKRNRPSLTTEKESPQPSPSWHRSPLKAAASQFGCLFKRKRSHEDQSDWCENNNEPSSKRMKFTPKGKSTRLSTVTEEDSDLSIGEGLEDVFEEQPNAQTNGNNSNFATPWWLEYEKPPPQSASSSWNPCSIM